MTLHPGSPDAAYAQYLIGSSYFDQIPDITRDQGRTERAMQALDEVVRKYPNTEYATAAKRKLEVARDQLAGKEMETARYYLKRREYIAAINRFKVVITQYQTTRHVEEALMRLAETYMSLGIVNEAQTAAAVLGHNFPDSPWYKDAYRIVKSGGLEPTEDQRLLDQQGDAGGSGWADSGARVPHCGRASRQYGRHAPRKRGVQYSPARPAHHECLRLLDHPPARMMTARIPCSPASRSATSF